MYILKKTHNSHTFQVLTRKNSSFRTMCFKGHFLFLSFNQMILKKCGTTKVSWFLFDTNYYFRNLNMTRKHIQANCIKVTRKPLIHNDKNNLPRIWLKILSKFTSPFFSRYLCITLRTLQKTKNRNNLTGILNQYTITYYLHFRFYQTFRESRDFICENGS